MRRVFVATLLLLVLLAGAAGTAHANASSAVACPGGTSASQLAAIIAHHLAAARTCYRAAARRCTGNFSSRRCLRAVKKYRRQLGSARADLDGVSVPSRLERPYTTTRRGLRTALRATRMAVRAIRADDFGGWVDALALHARAAVKLKRAADQLRRAVS